MDELTKLDVTNQVARRYGYRRLLEISTPFSGFTNGAFDRTQFTMYDRLVYRSNGANDGDNCSFSTSAETSLEITQGLLHNGIGDAAYDMAFIDPFHTHLCTTIDLLAAMALVRPGGTIVVHDCHPIDPQIVSATFPGPGTSWCGETYRAFVDFVLGRAQIDYFTVEADFGCGVIRRVQPRRVRHDAALELGWRAAAQSDIERFPFFREHEDRLLHLISPAQFRKRLGSRQR